MSIRNQLNAQLLDNHLGRISPASFVDIVFLLLILFFLARSIFLKARSSLPSPRMVLPLLPISNRLGSKFVLVPSRRSNML